MTRTITVNGNFNPQSMFTRLLHFGVSYGDLIRAGAQSKSWLEWSECLARQAGEYDDMGSRAARSQDTQSAAHFYKLASTYFHYSQIRVPVSPVKAERRARCHAAFRKFASLAGSGWRAVDIPYKEWSMPGFLLSNDASAPLVVLVGGLDSAKEVELAAFAQVFAERGLQCLIFDAPGQGELLERAPLELHFEKVLSAVLDYLAQRFSIRSAGVFGVSLGGHLAARAAAADSRVDACICLGGFYDTRALRRLPPFAAELLSHSLGLSSVANLDQALNGLSVADAAPSLAAPFMELKITWWTKSRLRCSNVGPSWRASGACPARNMSAPIGSTNVYRPWPLG
jgi:pimeloyl-ACP methyl ester carboxylesterase